MSTNQPEDPNVNPPVPPAPNQGGKAPNANNTDFVVAALSTSPRGKLEGCQVLKSSDPIPNTHKVVFGPASEDQCKAFVSALCGPRPGPDLSRRFFVIALAIYLLLMLMASVYALNRLMSA